MPVSWSITASLRCWMSERISGVERTATHRIKASGAMTRSGIVKHGAGVDPEADDHDERAGHGDAPTTPLIEKRMLSVMTGIASQDKDATRGPPSSQSAPAIVSSLPIQAVNISSSGRSTGHERVGGSEEAACGEQEEQGPPSEPRGHRRDRYRQDREGLAPDGRTRSSMSSMRSRSKSSRQSQDLVLAFGTAGSGRSSSMRDGSASAV